MSTNVDSQRQVGESSSSQIEATLPTELRRLLGSNWAEIKADTIKLLQQLLQIDTQNFVEEGSETEAVRHLETVFREAGVQYEVVEGKPGRGNIVARVPGDGSLGRGALLLSAHLDTVKAPKENWEAEGWKHDPYGAVIDEEDGCLYGRGAIDMKQMAAMSVVLLCFVKRHNIVLSRDLIFSGVADEENPSSKWGAKYLVQNRPDLVEADIVFNEIGGFTYDIQGTPTVLVQMAEKGCVQVKITARGPGGHGSLYHKTNPVATVGAVAQTLHTTKLPLRITTAATKTVESFASCLPFPKSVVLRQLLNPYLSGVIMNQLVPVSMQYTLAPLLHNTATPIEIGGGGGQANQVPTSAWVKIDARILPECDEEDVVQDIKSVLGPSRFESHHGPDGEAEQAELELEVLASRGPCWQDPDEAGCKEVLSIIRKVVYEKTGGTPISTVLIPGTTDSYWYSQHPSRTPMCIGFTPLRFGPEIKFADLFHGVNERVPIDGLEWGVEVLVDVVLMLCKARVDGE